MDKAMSCSSKKAKIDLPEQENKVQRHLVDYTPTYQKFVLKDRTYTQQYSHIYLKRLHQMRPLIEQSAKLNLTGTSWEKLKFCKVIDLVIGKPSIVMGTIYKTMKKKPCILDEMEQENLGKERITLQMMDNLASEDDTLILEDESGRIELFGDISVNELVTGVVVAIAGSIETDSEGLKVHKWWSANVSVVRSIPRRLENEYCLFLSGLEIGENMNLLSIQLLVDYVTGHLGNPEEEDFQGRIVRVIIAGNSLSTIPTPQIKQKDKKKHEQLQKMVEPLIELDFIVSRMASSVHVDMMPGEKDPAGQALPQQAFHKCLFPQSSRYSSYRTVSNPYQANIGGIDFLGTSGQPIRDIQRCTHGVSSHKSLENTLLWRHIAPTCPDTLTCYPCHQEDPFVVDKVPQVYFAGNQDHFETSVLQGNEGEIRIISIPSFHQTQSAVILDLKDLSCFPITFDSP